MSAAAVVLTALPFAALPGSQPSSYLLEEVALGYVTSGRQLLELAISAGRPADGLLALGGLPYGAAPDVATLALLPGKAALEELPGTRLEVDGLARAFRQARPGERVTLLTGAAVDAARLQRELPVGRGRTGYRYLHLATHGFFEPPPDNVVTRRLPDDPLGTEYRNFVRNPMLLSGLLLAGANSDPGKAVLTAEEVAGLDLRGAQLVVLSACDTGLGKVAVGEGVLGLQRGFHEAGARALAASLWSVSDAATSVLMEDFYHNLWHKRLTRLEALRQAQLAVLRDPWRGWRHGTRSCGRNWPSGARRWCYGAGARSRYRCPMAVGSGKVRAAATRPTGPPSSSAATPALSRLHRRTRPRVQRSPTGDSAAGPRTCRPRPSTPRTTKATWCSRATSPSSTRPRRRPWRPPAACGSTAWPSRC
jgi:CHAT domain-containing protein